MGSSAGREFRSRRKGAVSALYVKRGDLARGLFLPRGKGCVSQIRGLPCLALAFRTQRAAGRHRGGEFASPGLAGPTHHRTRRSDVQRDPAVQTNQKHTALMAAVAAVDVGMTY